jgi:hypothetical protein
MAKLGISGMLATPSRSANNGAEGVRCNAGLAGTYGANDE